MRCTCCLPMAGRESPNFPTCQNVRLTARVGFKKARFTYVTLTLTLRSVGQITSLPVPGNEGCF